jgi:hypothetical protein
MAQSGYTPLSLYYSATATTTPLAANLVAGELALNTADGKLFYKDSGGVVQVIASKAGNVNVSSFSGGTTGLTPNTATTGAVTLAGTLASANGGTGFSTYATGDVIYASASNTLSKLTAGTNGYVMTLAGGVPTWAAAAGGGASITNDTTTASNLYPLFAAATSGTPSTIYTSNAKYLYKPSTGELVASEHVASNGIMVNSATVSASYTIATGNNAMSVGPVSVASGQSVTVSSGQRWVIL